MIPLDLLFALVVVTTLLLSIASVTIIGAPRLIRLKNEYRSRVRNTLPYLSFLAGILVLNSLVRNFGMDFSWIIGYNITHDIFAIEGMVIPAIQSLANPWFTTYFSTIYIYGYIFLLVFPVLAYLALDDSEWLKTTALTYGLNYAIGLVCYLLFIAYGPRNLLPGMVDPLLYSNWATSRFLTSAVNSNTNVFPSLHTSLSISVALLAYRTRDVYSRWLPVAAVLSTSVIVSTMYLGIHWATDVVFGVFLGIGSVLLARHIVRATAPDYRPGASHGLGTSRSSIISRIREALGRK